MSTSTNKILLAFDFDHTLINDNSDLYIKKLAPGGKLPEEVKSLYRDDGWTHFMGEVFRYLHQNNVTPERLLECLAEIEFTPGMQDLLTSVDKEKFEVIIISDSNSVFIDHLLRTYGLSHRINKVFTNPAKFNNDGLLEIEMYHFQDSCKLSTKNLCKGQILESYIDERATNDVSFSHIAYVGDGLNDLCPSLRLESKDFVFPRHGFSLVGHIKRVEKEDGLFVKARVHTWNSGHDILRVLQQNLLENCI